MDHWSIFIIGFIAQALFSARLLLQWILSEKAKKVVSPAIFWKLSILASFMLFVYGWIRDDFAIILGQIFTYYIYIWNLDAKGSWRRLNVVVRYVLLSTPVCAVGYMLLDWNFHYLRLFHNEDIPMWLLIYGSAGQIIFTLRFVYQWAYSSRQGESVLPRGFWIISLVGSVVIVSYAVYRLDPVLILGQSTGIFVYIRNLFIIKKSRQG